LLLLSAETTGNAAALSRPFAEMLTQATPARAKFTVHHTLDFYRWRFRRPGYTYQYLSLAEGQQLVWKEYLGKKQIVMSTGLDGVACLGGRVDLWQLAGSDQERKCARLGFTPIYENHLIVYSDLVLPQNADEIRFELCDNDVF
jgi:hypothetical protein